ncbi:MAG: hypothetical protein JWP82_3013 [Humibacillus sp.]|nr:hypothetical protein [Humibacillus sp.]
MRWERPASRMTDDEQVDELLVRATEDWLHPGDVFDVARHAAPADDAAYVEQAIELTRSMLVTGLAVAGDLTEAGFQPWLGDAGEAHERIAALWRADPEAAPASFSVWLAATPAGADRGEQVLAHRDQPAD